MNNRRPKRDVDPVGGVREEVGTHGSHECLGQRHGYKQRAEHVEAGEIPLADHCVDDLLNQQRVEQPQQLHEEACYYHLDQAVAVLADGRDEPAEAKAGLGGAGAGLEIQQGKRLALALVQELIAGDPHLAALGISD